MNYLYTDGSHWIKYNMSAIGGYLLAANDQRIFEFRENVLDESLYPYHEILALKKGLSLCAEHQIKTVHCFIDSKTIVEKLNAMLQNPQRAQLNTQKLKNDGNYALFYRLLDDLFSFILELKFTDIRLEWIRREQNRNADKLSKPNMWSKKEHSYFYYDNNPRYSAQATQEVIKNNNVHYIIDTIDGCNIYKWTVGKKKKVLVFSRQAKRPIEHTLAIIDFLRTSQDPEFNLNFRANDIGQMLCSFFMRRITSRTLFALSDTLQEIARGKKISIFQNQAALIKTFGKIDDFSSTLDSSLYALARCALADQKFLKQIGLHRSSEAEIVRAQKMIFRTYFKHIMALESPDIAHSAQKVNEVKCELQKKGVKLKW